MGRNVPRFGENSGELLEVELGVVCRKSRIEAFCPIPRSHTWQGWEKSCFEELKLSLLGSPWKSNFNLVYVNVTSSS